MVTSGRRGIGLAGNCPVETITAVASAAERAEFHTIWLSQPSGGDSLAILGELQETTQTIKLGVGAIPLTAMPAPEIAHRVRDLSLPLPRLRLGIGSGTGIGALDRLRRGTETLRALLAVEIVAAPLGPRMCRLAGELSDTVLLTWVTPAHASRSIGWVEEGAAAVGRERPTVCAYVRCALGAASQPRIDADCVRYGAIPHYAAHFRRQGVVPSETTILATSEVEMHERLAPFEAVLDEVVVRAITPNDTTEEVLKLVEAMSPVA